MNRRTFMTLTLSTSVLAFQSDAAAKNLGQVNGQFGTLMMQYDGAVLETVRAKLDYLQIVIDYAQAVIALAPSAGPIGLAVAYVNLSDLERFLDNWLAREQNHEVRNKISLALNIVRIAKAKVVRTAARLGLSEDDLIEIVVKLPKNEVPPFVLPRNPGS